MGHSALNDCGFLAPFWECSSANDSEVQWYWLTFRAVRPPRRAKPVPSATGRYPHSGTTDRALGRLRPHCQLGNLRRWI